MTWLAVGKWIAGVWAKFKAISRGGSAGQTALGIATRQATASATGDYAVALAGHGHTVNINSPPERKEERVAVKVGLDSIPSFYADIYNCGEITVHIKMVVLCGVDEPGGLIELTLLPTKMVATTGSGGPEYLSLGNAPDQDLQPRKEVRFRVFRLSRGHLDNLLACPEETIHLSIRAFEGEIHRVGGAELLPSLRDLAAMMKSIQEDEERRISREFMEGTFRPLDL